MKKLFIFLTILLITSPLILSIIFINIGHRDKNGRITLIDDTANPTEEIQKATREAMNKNTQAIAEILQGFNIKQDNGNSEATIPQLGASPYYKVDITTPKTFADSVIGRGFDEGFGYQCVAGFKQFMFSLSGKIIATKTGGASGYATQQNQIEPLGFKWYSGAQGLQNGDWAIFGGGQYGHVAMYYQGQWLGQNQGATNPNTGKAFNLVSLPTNNIIGYYRPNIYQNKPANSPQNPPKQESRKDTQSEQTTPQNGSYTVKQGDTLGGIIINNGWRNSQPLYGDDGQAQAIADKNNIENRGLIYPNQIINR